MDRDTVAHYGWIVVWTLVIFVVIILATPFGKYVSTSVQNYIAAFYEAIEDVENDIEKDKIDIDINLNGSYIITKKEGNPTCYVFEVNGAYDGYSLENIGVAPNVDDRYFRCIDYIDIEEHPSVQEMFVLAAKLGYDDTTEGRQGIQCALLYYVTGGDYSDYASKISTIARNVYDDLLSRNGTLSEDVYKNIELIVIEKDGYIDMIFLKNIRIVTETEGKGQMRTIKLDDEYVYCFDMEQRRPLVNAKYIEIEMPNNVNISNLEKAFHIIYEYNDNTYQHRVVSQCFLWTIIEGKDCSNKIIQFVNIDIDTAKEMYNDMLYDYNNLVEYKKYDIQFYECIDIQEDAVLIQRLIGYTAPEE